MGLLLMAAAGLCILGLLLTSAFRAYTTFWILGLISSLALGAAAELVFYLGAAAGLSILGLLLNSVFRVYPTFSKLGLSSSLTLGAAASPACWGCC